MAEGMMSSPVAASSKLWKKMTHTKKALFPFVGNSAKLGTYGLQWRKSQETFS
jgi:hypothetical protein